MAQSRMAFSTEGSGITQVYAVVESRMGFSVQAVKYAPPVGLSQSRISQRRRNSISQANLGLCKVGQNC
jgi:hypothetical protein